MAHSNLYAIRGNHDDPSYWDGRYDGKWSNINLVKDYTVLEIETRKVLFVGGAISLDKVMRIKGEDWWEDEGFNYDEDKLIEVLDKHCPIDIVVTHNCPEFAHPAGTSGFNVDHFCSITPGPHRLELQAERSVIARMYDVMVSKHCKPGIWAYGHYHRTNIEYINETKFMLLGIGEGINV